MAFSADSYLSGIDEQAPNAQGGGDDNDFVVTRNGNKETISKTQYLYAPNLSEREYLQRIFAGQINKYVMRQKTVITAFATPTDKTVKPLYCVFLITSSYGKIGSLIREKLIL